jgi:nucleoside-diphosphate-sugar epimerase
MRVLFAGGSGVLGQLAGAKMRAAGHEVTLFGRGAANDLRADLLDREAVLRAVEGRDFDVVVHAATALAGKSMTRHQSMAGTDVLRTTGTRNLVEAVRATGAGRMVAESMVFGYGYGDHGAAPVTEAGTPFGPHSDDRGQERHVSAMRVKEELMLRTEGIEGIALRFGVFYGVGVTDTTIVPMLRRRALPVIAGGHYPISWVDISDAADALTLAVTAGRPGEAYNIADDQPLDFATHVGAVAQAFGTPRPMTVPHWLLRAAPLARAVLLSRIELDNTKAKDELGWLPSHRDSVTGVRAVAAGASLLAA